MKQKHAWSIVTAGLLCLGSVGVAFATPPDYWHGNPWLHAPEIDPGSLGSGLALLAGSVLLVVEKYRRRKRTMIFFAA
jgi:hypothetical protein